ncbi:MULTISPECIES: YfiR family protein [Niastella]|uniref:YfiR family protein n=1 Tax=Niastella soli TaxID=2821487 RepID=A0ABS3Z192_9BACT|nr:YfiR family protein [Niastella soli]MBO9203932.1 YfiR family protein [Niastella soli]
MKTHVKVPFILFKAVLVIFVFLFFPLIEAWSQGNYAIQANIIYRFTKYVNWPYEKNAGDFVIGIVGDTPLYDELTHFTANKAVSGRAIAVKKFSASAPNFNCQILFISDEESGSIKRIATSTSGMPTLLVSESEGVARQGSCINFVIVDDHLKLEINKTAIEKRTLDIATELLNLGTIVK